MTDGFVTLCRRPYIWKEPGSIRWPGVLELNWQRCGFAFTVINEGLDRDHPWSWMLHIHLLWMNLFLHFPGKLRAIFHKDGSPAYGEWEQWGFSTHWDGHGGIHLNWGMRTKIIDWPWTYTFIYKEELRDDGVWELRQRHDWKLGYPRTDISKLTRVSPYTYVLKSGEVQNRIATVTEGRWYRRRRFIKWTSWMQWIDHCIEVEFSDEVGERSGSWKGGCTGCGYAINPGETAEQCLRRMEKERKF